MLHGTPVHGALDHLAQLEQFVVLAAVDERRQGNPGQLARFIAGHELECRIRLDDPSSDIDSHDTEHGCIEDRAEPHLARSQSFFGPFSLSDVHHHALPIELPRGNIADDGGLLAHPGKATPPRDQPILGADRRKCSPRFRVCSDHAVAVVGVQDLEPQLALPEPFGDRVAEHVLDLWADVQRLGMRRVIQDAVEVGGDSGDVFDQRTKPLLEPGPDRPFGLGCPHLGLVIVDGHSGSPRASLVQARGAQVHHRLGPELAL